MFERGYFTVGQIRGVPVRLHWSLPLGALFFSGMRFAPAFWLAFFGLVFVHELGHAALVRRYRHQVLSVDITGFGGLCRWRGHPSAHERGVIAWGGVAAQALVLLATLGTVALFGSPTSWTGAQVVDVLVRTNLWLIGFNLLPVQPFDGAEAWQLLRRYVARLRTRWGGPGQMRR